LPHYLYFLIACTVFSLVFSYKNGFFLAKITACFFLALLIVELVCNQLTITDGIYNIWYPLEFCFYSLFVYSYIKYRKKVRFLALLFFAIVYCYVYQLTHWNSINTFYTFGYCVCCLVLFILVILKIYELLTDEDDLRLPLKIPLFWFLFGLILNLTSFLLFGMKNFILSDNYNLYLVLQKANQIISSLQYVCFILYFFCSWKYQNWSL
jgi:hypothetical protein